MECKWVEDDFPLPDGVMHLNLPEPVSGRKYVMYHGTKRESAQSIQATGFRRSAGGILGPGVYLCRDLEKASRYPRGVPDSDKVVIKVVVDVGRVIAIRREGHPRQKTWQDPRYSEVYDTAWIPPNRGVGPSDLEEDCVWDPNRIQILKIIKPRPNKSSVRYGDWFHPNSAIRWTESDVRLPEGVDRLDLLVPQSGRKYVMYHGTTFQAAQSILANGFRCPAVGVLETGVYLSRDLQKASRYPIDCHDSNKVVIRVVVDVGKVLIIDQKDHPHQKTCQDWRDGEMYDTAWVLPGGGMMKSCLEAIYVRDPNQIWTIGTITPQLVQTWKHGEQDYICKQIGI